LHRGAGPRQKDPIVKTYLLASFAATAFALAASLCATGPAIAGEESLDIDNRFRAKIAKEKVKQAANERRLGKDGKPVDANATCGSQNIGNVDTGGRPGASPREVFVFAPNAVNIVTRGGCR
jgi:hypothetical protein